MKLSEFDFRVWNNETERYETNKPLISLLMIDVLTRMAHLNGNKFEIELWTGLYDKNGKKIYEGDIVKYFKGIVLIHYIFTETKFALCEKQGNQYFLIEELRYSNRDEYEVIGNIHENAELLNENKPS